MNQNPDEIRRDIERTRAELSDNVNALGDRTDPGNIARSQVDKVKDGANSLKEKVFGSDTDPYDSGAVGSVGDRAHGLANDVGDRAHALAHDARQAVDDVPRQIKSQTRGNPIAAGLIAAGVGALIGSLIPASRREQRYAEQLKDAAEPAMDEVKQMANEAKDHLQPKAEQAFEDMKPVAQDAADNVKGEAQHAADTVKDESQSAADHVKGDAQAAADDTKQDVEETRDNL